MHSDECISIMLLSQGASLITAAEKYDWYLAFWKHPKSWATISAKKEWRALLCSAGMGVGILEHRCVPEEQLALLLLHPLHHRVRCSNDGALG